MFIKRLKQLIYILHNSLLTIKNEGISKFLQRVRTYIKKRHGIRNIFSHILLIHPMPVNQLLRNRFANSSPLRIYTSNLNKSRVILITDSINKGTLYGGVATGIIFSALLAEHLDFDLRVITRREKPFKKNFGKILKLNDIHLKKNVEFIYSDINSEINEVDTNDNDIFITTSWWTTKSTMASVDIGQIIYLLQEDERIFYPYGDERLQCSRILSNPKLRYLINSKILYDYFVKEGFQNIKENGIAFEPAFSSNYFYFDKSLSLKKEKMKFFFYSRPNHPRNLFYLGLEVINEAVERNIINIDNWDIYLIGSDVPPIVFGSDYYPIILPTLEWDDYCNFIKSVDLGLCLMYSPHPSYPPLDIAACGAVVVTNNYDNKKDLSHYSMNIICKELDIDNLLQGIEEGVIIAANFEQRYANYCQNKLVRDWKESFHDIIQNI